MKKFLALASLVVATQAAFANGNVSFVNAGFTPQPLVSDASGALLVGQNYVAQLYFGAVGAASSTFQPVALTTGAASTPLKFRVATTTSPGTWASGGTRVITGFSNPDTVALEVRVWDTNFGADFATASKAEGAQWGVAAFNYTIPVDTAPPASFQITGMQPLKLTLNPVTPIVPEPSTLALGALGLGALLLRRRN